MKSITQRERSKTISDQKTGVSKANRTTQIYDQQQINKHTVVPQIEIVTEGLRKTQKGPIFTLPKRLLLFATLLQEKGESFFLFRNDEEAFDGASILRAAQIALNYAHRGVIHR